MDPDDEKSLKDNQNEFFGSFDEDFEEVDNYAPLERSNEGSSFRSIMDDSFNSPEESLNKQNYINLNNRISTHNSMAKSELEEIVENMPSLDLMEKELSELNNMFTKQSNLSIEEPMNINSDDKLSNNLNINRTTYLKSTHPITDVDPANLVGTPKWLNDDDFDKAAVRINRHQSMKLNYN